ncbi:MAG TPA: sigma-70 family RNA polymerase sigma factor [Pirellulales bacterium]|jgi:RNA polymerase sigma-70 factor (ECF subfamily)|nr:sigma-70 family RNA polymerase sigma factor [Pirellulales bacterium]
MLARNFLETWCEMLDWDELVRREGTAVWRTIYRLVRNQADADECFQETFVAALELSNRQPVRNWPALLQCLATSRAVDRVRKKLRRTKKEEISDLARAETMQPGPAQQAEAAERATKLRWALAQIPARQAEIFCLHELGGWKYEALAERFAMTVNAVGVLLHRTRKKLQDLLSLQGALSESLLKQRPA